MCFRAEWGPRQACPQFRCGHWGQAIWKQGPENQKIPTCKGRQRVKGQKGGAIPPCGRGAAAKWTWRHPSQKKRQEVRGSQRRPVLPKGQLPPRRHKKGGEPPRGARLPAAGKHPPNSRPLQTSAAKPQKGRAQTASPTAGADAKAPLSECATWARQPAAEKCWQDGCPLKTRAKTKRLPTIGRSANCVRAQPAKKGRQNRCPLKTRALSKNNRKNLRRASCPPQVWEALTK